MKARILVGVLMTLLVALGSGCALLVVGAAAGAGAGTVAYVRGELKSSEAASLNKTYAAAQRAMKDMEYAITEDQKDAATAKITARGAGDKKITVRLERESESVTKIGIRVGTFGDESLSRLILEKIQKRL